MLVGIAERRALPAAEAVIGDRDRDRDVDADHANLDIGGKIAGGCPIAGENRDAVAILMPGRQARRLLKAAGTHHLQHGAENLLLIGPHARLDMVKQRRADEKALLMALQAEPASVDQQLCAFVDTHLDIGFDLRFVRGGDDRAVVRVLVGRHADAELLDFRPQPVEQRGCGLLTDRHHHRQGHAALPGRAEGRADQIGDGLVHVGVGQHDAVVLGPAHRLDALSSGDAALIDIMGDVR